MDNLVNPEFVNIGNEVDIKVEDSEMANGISVEPNYQVVIKNEDNCEFEGSEMVNEPEEPKFQIIAFEDESEASHTISCPMCHCPFDPLTQIEDHLYFEHCQSSNSVNNGKPSVIYPCQLYPCLFMSHRKSTLVLHYFEHIDGPVNKNSSQKDAILPDSNCDNLPDPLARLEPPILNHQNDMNHPIRLITPKRQSVSTLKIKEIKKFPCIEPGCIKRFNKLWDLKIHKVEDHQLKGHNVIDPVPFWTCDYCNLTSLGKKLIINHTKEKHRGKELKISSYSQRCAPGRPRKTHHPKAQNLFWDKYFRMIQDPNFKDFYQCVEEGCDLRFALVKLIRRHLKNDHGVEWRVHLHQKRYESVILKCKKYGIYQCKLCEWVGPLNPMVHLKSVHNDEYSQSLADGYRVKNNLAGRPRKAIIHESTELKRGTKSTHSLPRGRPRKNLNRVAQNHGSLVEEKF